MARQGIVPKPQAPPTQEQDSAPCPALWVHAGDHVQALAFSLDGQWLATAAQDSWLAPQGNPNRITIWNAATGKAERTWDMEQTVHQVVFSPNGDHLASVDLHGKVNVWDFRKGTLVYAAEGGLLAYSPDGKLWAASGFIPAPKSGPATQQCEQDCDVPGTSIIEIHEAATGKLVRTIDAGGWAVISALTITPSGLVFAAGCDQGSEVCEGSVAVWSVASGKLVKNYAVGGMAFSSDGQWLADLDSAKREVKVFDLSNGEERQSFPRHDDDGRIQAAGALSPDGREIALVQHDRIKSNVFEYQSSIGVWDAVSGKEIKTLQAPWDSAVDSQGVSIVPKTAPTGFWPLAFSPDGKRLAAANYRFEMQKAIRCVSRPNAVTTWYSQIKIWDVPTGRVLLTLESQTP